MSSATTPPTTTARRPHGVPLEGHRSARRSRAPSSRPDHGRDQAAVAHDAAQPQAAPEAAEATAQLAIEAAGRGSLTASLIEGHRAVGVVDLATSESASVAHAGRRGRGARKRRRRVGATSCADSSVSITPRTDERGRAPGPEGVAREAERERLVCWRHWSSAGGATDSCASRPGTAVDDRSRGRSRPPSPWTSDRPPRHSVGDPRR